MLLGYDLGANYRVYNLKDNKKCGCSSRCRCGRVAVVVVDVVVVVGSNPVSPKLHLRWTMHQHTTACRAQVFEEKPKVTGSSAKILGHRDPVANSVT